MSLSSLSSITTNDDQTDNNSSCTNFNLPRLSYDKCPRCMVQFDFLKRVNTAKVPLILNCKHTVCEDCIKRMCLSNNMVCPICKEKFAVLRSQLDSLTELFQPHFTLIGQLVWNKNSSAKKQFNWISTGATLGSKHFSSGDNPEGSNNTEVDSEEDSDEYEKDMEPLIFDKCSEHYDEFVNMKCEECQDICCCYCFIENHPGHKAVHLYKLNEEEKHELEKLKIDIEVILAQLLASKKQVKEVKSFDPSTSEQMIKSCFVNLHAKLHLAERNIRKKLSDVEAEEADVQVISALIRSGLHRVKHILSHFKLLNTKHLNKRALLKEVQEIKNIPCRLISEQGFLQPIEFTAESMFDDIEENFFIKSLSSSDYSLVPVEDWSKAQEKYDFEQIKRCSQERVHSERKTEAAAAVKSSKHAENQAKKSNDGKVRVVVTHINNLNSFYVQKYSDLENLKQMNSIINRRGKKKTVKEEFKIGGIYGVKYETRSSNFWRRGKVLEILKPGHQDCQYKIFFIDYGNTKLITREKLKELELYVGRRAPFALECRIYNPDNITFEHNAHLHLPQIIRQKELYVRFISPQMNSNSVHEVELLVAASNGGFIPVRDLLVPTSPVLEVNNSLLGSELRLFKSSQTFVVGQEEQVVVTHVRDPDYICVLLARNLKILEKMHDEMKQYYKDVSPLPCVPIVDSDVVVKYDDEIHGKWHRAKITSVNVASKEVGVYFADWGKSVVVSWSKLRLLTENFIRVECLAIVVKLADIENPNKTNSWDQKTTEFLLEQIGTNKEHKMVVSNVQPLEVALFRMCSSADMCLNALLVEKHYALSAGNISLTVFWPNHEIKTEEEEEEDDLSFQMMKKSEDALMVDYEDEYVANEVNLQVSVVSFETPDLIYLKPTKYKEKEDEMQRDLQIHYSSKKFPVKNSWKPGENCVIFDKVHSNYYRAVIKSVCGNDNYVVYLYDHVRELKLSKRAIFEQDTYFQNFKCYVFKCKLSNIKPAGDAGKWSQLANEMLEKIFTTYKSFYIKKVEMCEEKKMMGVLMWYCLTTAAKALEPAKIRYISVNKSLIQSGVAFVSKSPSSSGVDSDQKSSETPKKQNWADMLSDDESNDDPVNVDNTDKYFHPTVQESWPKPFKLQKHDFDAILTCVDIEGLFSFRTEEIQALYLDVEKQLNATFNSMSHPIDNTVWQVNDMCTIADDGKWYRGTVLKVQNEEILVEMIDFGSAHSVTSESLSRAIMLPDCPPLVNKIRLYDVHSKNGAWTAKDVTTMVEIVTDHIRVVIKGDLNADIPMAEVYLDNGLSCNDLITQKLPHMIRHENSVVLEPGFSGDQDNPKKDNVSKDYNYNYLVQAFKKNEKISVVNVLKWDDSYNVVLSINENNTKSADFQKMNEKIQKQIAKQPSVQQVEVNAPCVCLHRQKNLWSRAIIYNTSNISFGHVLAFFVDYGTLEMVPVADLKEIKPEWLKFPVYMQIALINVELLESSQAEYVLIDLNNLRGKYVNVKVVSESPLKVHLYDGKNLSYQHFVSCGILKAL